MKQLIRYACCCLLLATAGCSKYLGREPDNRVQLNTPQKISQLLGTAYPQANYSSFAETMSDNVTDLGSGGIERIITDPYLFSDSHDTQEDTPEFYWFACYSAIAVANQALAAISAFPDSSSLAAQKGEALVARAYSHLMLVSLFSKFYNEATAASDIGIPYVTVPETIVIKQYDRKTVKYVYDMIENDLLTGLPLINDNNYSVPKYHFTKTAAYAFASRFYLYKKDYAKVIQYANLAFPGNSFVSNLRGWNTTYASITDVYQLQSTYAKATENANLLLVETYSYWYRNFDRNRYGLGAAIQKVVFKRPEPLTGGTWAIKQYTSGEVHYLVPKINEYFVKVSVNAEIGNPYVMVPLFTTEEVLFNRAEAYAYTGNSAGAIADLNTYASTRFLNYSATTNNITAAKINSAYGTTDIRTGLIQAILDYRRAEFIHEGMRWFDILRYGLTVSHPNFQGSTLTLTANDLRKVWQIPSSSTLSGLAQNPR